MESSSKLPALLLICMLFISVTPPILACNTCLPPRKVKPPKHKTPIVHPPVIKPPPVVVPPITVPPITVPPITVPPVIPVLPPVIPVLPPVVPILPPVVPILPPVVPILPPVVNPPVLKPPVLTPGCPPPPAPLTCPVDTLKLGACVDLLGGLLKVKIGDPAANHCCPILGGLLELEAAVCLCTTIKMKLLNLDIYLPIALKLLATCGKTPPPGYSCKA